MIDTDKYEGHTVRDMTFSQAGERLWFLEKPHAHNASDCMIMNKETLDLIMDAPLLLAEVKDLQKKLDNLREYCHAEGYDIFNWEVKNIEVIE